MSIAHIKASSILRNVRYEIRGELARRAAELEKSGYEIIKLNIGNPGEFGFRMPETMRLAMIENLQFSEGYGPSKGIFPAREAVVMQQQERGVMDACADTVYIGNGVSELIMMCLRALLEEGDEVLVPAPDYPLWSAAVTIHEGRPVYYPCPPELGYQPDLEAVARLIGPKTKAIVIINPNNPSGAVYPRATLEALVRLAEEHHLVIFADEIYDRILYDGAEHVPLATLVHKTLCATLSGLSKVYRACGIRVGWVSFSGEKDYATDYFRGLDLLASLRLSSNVPGQWAVQTALGGFQSIDELCQPGGRLYDSRQVAIEAARASRYLALDPVPQGAMYGWMRIRPGLLPDFQDQRFGLDLLEQKRVLISPGSSFNVPYRDHFRITFLPEARVMKKVFARIEELLAEYASA